MNLKLTREGKVIYSEAYLLAFYEDLEHKYKLDFSKLEDLSEWT